MLLPLFSSQCKKEGENCHYDLTFENISDKKIIVAYILSIYNSENKCRFVSLSNLNPNDKYLYGNRYCWEDELKYIKYEFYFLDFDVSTIGPLFDCDSIQYEPGVLKHIILTKDDLDDLRSTGFTISYP